MRALIVAGIPFTSLAQILPFILVGIGVDDMVSKTISRSALLRLYLTGNLSDHPSRLAPIDRWDRSLSLFLALVFIPGMSRLAVLRCLSPPGNFLPQFVIVASFDHTDPDLEVENRVAKALERCGLSITCKE